jgi:hypothetical protein
LVLGPIPLYSPHSTVTVDALLRGRGQFVSARHFSPKANPRFTSEAAKLLSLVGKTTLLAITKLTEECAAVLQIDALMVRQESNNTHANLTD